MASGIARGRVRTTVTVESRKMAAIPQIIVHSTKLLNFDWSRAIQLIPNCTP